jgi:hypothetical protein
MDNIDLTKAEKSAQSLGQDFLTWLWYYTEYSSGYCQDRSGQDCLVAFEQRIAVQGGEGESLDKAVSSGPHSELKEVKIGLQQGKKVQQARVRIEQDNFVWRFQIKAEDLSLNSYKTPKVTLKTEEGEDPDGPFLEKMFLLEKGIEILDNLFTQFLHQRFSDRWPEERRAVQKWIAGL